MGGTVVATYTYDALNRRIGFKDNGTQTWTVYDGQSATPTPTPISTAPARCWCGTSTARPWTRSWRERSSGGTTAWYLTDRLGTRPQHREHDGDACIDHVVYDSFGNVTSESNAANGDRFKFTAREYDAATGHVLLQGEVLRPACLGDSRSLIRPDSRPVTPIFSATPQTPRQACLTPPERQAPSSLSSRVRP